MERSLDNYFFNNVFTDATYLHNLTPFPPSDFVSGSSWCFSSSSSSPPSSLFSSSQLDSYTQLGSSFTQLGSSFMLDEQSTHSHQQHFFDFLSKPTSPPSRKRCRLESALTSSDGCALPQKDLARERRQKISDRTRSLQKLMPWNKKMDIATTLEEAYKYVKYLQAQVKALSSMPINSSFIVQNDYEKGGFGGKGVEGGGLGMLNRQQLLQVLVNSPVAQTMLYSKGFCVFSLEQLLFMNKLSQLNVLMESCNNPHLH